MKNDNDNMQMSRAKYAGCIFRFGNAAGVFCLKMECILS